jgi:hypothetical protein
MIPSRALHASYVRTALSLSKSETLSMRGLLTVCPHALTLGIHTNLNDWWDGMLAGADKRIKRSRSERTNLNDWWDGHLECLEGAE